MRDVIKACSFRRVARRHENASHDTLHGMAAPAYLLRPYREVRVVGEVRRGEVRRGEVRGGEGR